MYELFELQHALQNVIKRYINPRAHCFFQFHGKTVKVVSGKSFQSIAICLDKLHTHTQSHVTKLVFIYI